MIKFYSLLFFFLLSPSSTSALSHPLDPLTPSEFVIIANTIKSSHLSSSSHPLNFHYIGLDDPDKPLLLSHLSSPSTTPPPPRRAFVIARTGHQTHEILVDIASKTIVSDHIYRGFGYPLLTLEEQFAASLLPLNYTPFIESVKKREVEMKDVVCTTFTVGWFGEVKQGRRTIKILCFVTGETVNLYVRPLEGITVVVDLDDLEIVEYEDRFVVPVPTAAGTDYRTSKQSPPFGSQAAPVTVVQPERKGFKIDGHMVRLVSWTL